MSYINFLPEIMELGDDISIEKVAEVLGYELLQKEAEEEIILEGILALDRILNNNKHE